MCRGIPSIVNANGIIIILDKISAAAANEIKITSGERLVIIEPTA